jgi:hypothetical protein
LVEAGRNQLVVTPLLLPVQWDVPKVAGKSRDLQGKHVGSLGGGAIGSLVMERLKVTSRAQAPRTLRSFAWAPGTACGHAVCKMRM